MRVMRLKFRGIPSYMRAALSDPENIFCIEQLRVKYLSDHIPCLPGDRHIVVPWSGGLDSTSVLLQAIETGAKITTFYLDYGQQYVEKEIAVIERLRRNIIRAIPAAGKAWEKHVVLDRHTLNAAVLHRLPGDWKHILPMRNFAVLEEASLIHAGEYGEIWFGCVMGETPYSGGDKSIVFFTEMAASLARRHRLLVMPLIGQTKGDIVRSATLDVTRYNILCKTVSCYSGGKQRQCGACMSCFTRFVAFSAAGKPEDVGFTPDVQQFEALIDSYSKRVATGEILSHRRLNEVAGALRQLG